MINATPEAGIQMTSNADSTKSEIERFLEFYDRHSRREMRVDSDFLIAANAEKLDLVDFLDELRYPARRTVQKVQGG